MPDTRELPEGHGKARTSPALGCIARIEAWALRAPIATPVVTSFGTMRDRPAVFVRLTGDDGAQGWGEAWCNFPGVGAEHRARLLIDTVAPLAMADDWPEVARLWRTLEARLHVLALQTGEPGPLAQCAAAIDIAAWDLAARRAGRPLWRMLADAQEGPHRGPGGDSLRRSAGQARVYASGLHPKQASELALAMRERGHRAFKMKVGFDPASDLHSLHALRAAVGDDAILMVDANQAWAPQQARERIAALAAVGPIWTEEPITADHDPADWSMLAAGSATPLAAGENLRGLAAFDAILHSRALAYIQPDVGKWGGLTGCREVASNAPGYGAVFCPHWLGGPIGLLASMHLRAALGNEGWVEWDANPNPMHECVQAQLPTISEGCIALGDNAGLGLDLDIAHWQHFVRWQGEARRSGG